MVSGFLGEHRGEGGVFRGKDGLRFGFLGGCCEFGSSGQLGSDR